MNKYRIITMNEWTEKDVQNIDEFILNENSNGEFINSVKYLSYHRDRFEQDSIMVKDCSSGVIKCVIMASVDKEENSIMSHFGTTFSGPVINFRDSYKNIKEAVNMALDYYESKYDRLIFKICPTHYAKQEMGILDYIFLCKGYQYGMQALANIIDLNSIDSEERLFSLYKANRRNHVKKSQKCGEFCCEKKDYVSKEVWDNMNHNLKVKFNAETTHSYEEIKELQTRMPNHIIPYEVRTRADEYAAFALVYKFKNVFHTQYLDVNYNFSNKYPNLLLIHHLLKEAVSAGYKTFSFGACTENRGKYINEGLYEYKAGYGGGSIILPAYMKEKV